MIIRATRRSIRTLSVAGIIIAAATLSSSPAHAAETVMTTYSTVGCVAKNPKQRDLLIPTARGLFNSSSRASVVVFCPLANQIALEGWTAVEGCGSSFRQMIYEAFFSIAPAVSDDRPGRMWSINADPYWAQIEANDSGGTSTSKPVQMRGVSTPNPLEKWDGTANYISTKATLNTVCTSDWDAPTIRLQIPPKAYATGIRIHKYPAVISNGT